MNVDHIAKVVENLPPEQALDAVLAARESMCFCLTSSFQAEDMAVLHILRKRIPDLPVLFLETGYHFPQTYEYRDRMTKEWSLRLLNVLPSRTVPEQESAFGILYQTDPTRCCQLRKVDPLLGALEPFDVWFTGLRREQSPTRKNLKKVELHRLPTGKQLWKVSLLADWKWEQVWDYTNANGISHLPQYDEGYLSIGCQPCTALPVDPNNPRSGRWGGTKLECGIHTFSKRGEA
ncbi:MAG TPA: phosphoadenylyl-sulfate reductase [Candidatus Elarobacter sp.]|nr:phosphoadenylyl-sulfate reductase [Candidatus Elarobacter sp.]